MTPQEYRRLLIAANAQANGAAVGFDFGKAFADVGKTLQKAPWDKITAVTKQVGSAVGTIYPPAGVVIGAAAAITTAATDGNKKAQEKVAAVKQGAAAGDPAAVAASQAIVASQAIRAHEVKKAEASGDMAEAEKIRLRMEAVAKLWAMIVA